MRAFMAVTKALSDQNRVSIVLALEGRELCVCQIIKFLGLAPSTVSKHLSILKLACLIEDRKDGRWMYYRLAGEDAPTEVREAIGWVCRSFADSHSQKIKKDAQRLQTILALDPKELCNQRNRSVAVS